MNHKSNYESHIKALPEAEQADAKAVHDDLESARLITLSALTGTAPVDAFMEVFKRLQDKRAARGPGKK